MAPVRPSLIENCPKPCSETCNCKIKPDCAGPIERVMQQHLTVQLHLCSQLEEIADELPESIDPQKLLVVARSILPTVKRAHEFEETRVFPQIQAEAIGCRAISTSLERLKFEHWEDESFAEELCDGLIKFVTMGTDPSPDTLGYMLRGFFEGLRRHIAFEMDHILPLLRQPPGYSLQ